jgi:hypothetical protein
VKFVARQRSRCVGFRTSALKRTLIAALSLLRPAFPKRLRQGIAAACLMLHLRARYVSKAAILTVPVLLVLVENRSPA